VKVGAITKTLPSFIRGKKGKFSRDLSKSAKNGSPNSSMTSEVNSTCTSTGNLKPGLLEAIRAANDACFKCEGSQVRFEKKSNECFDTIFKTYFATAQ